MPETSITFFPEQRKFSDDNEPSLDSWVWGVKNFEVERKLAREHALVTKHSTSNDEFYVEQPLLENPDSGSVFGALFLASFLGFITGVLSLFFSYGTLAAFGVYCVSSVAFFFVLLLVAIIITSLFRRSHF